LIGVVAAAVDLAQYQSFVPARNLPPAGVVGIINGEGTIISRSEDAEQRVGRVSDAPSAKLMLEQRRGVIRSLDYKGIDRLYAFTSIPRSDWIVFTSLDIAAVLAPAQRLAFERLVFAIAAMLAVSVLTLWVSRRIARPVEAISRSMTALTAGDLDARPTAGGPMEIHQIAVEFNAMLDARVKATDSLRASRATLDAAMDSMFDAVFISDVQGRFTHFNAAFATFHKFKNKEECAKTLAEYPMFLDVYSTSGEFLPLEQWAVPRALQGETAVNAEFTLKRKDTGDTWIGSYNFAPIRNKDGAIVGSVVTARDITERMQTEAQVRRLHEELRQHAAELEQRVSERTAQLEVAKSRAEAADRVKSAFLATMSHELRTPLNSIIGFTGILLQKLPGPLNAEQEKQLGFVRSASRHLLSLISDVLDISKVEAGELHLARERVDLRGLLERLGTSFALEAQRRNLAFALDMGQDEAILMGDARRVEQVINNLLSNALKFTPRGSIVLTCRQEGACLVIAVTDTGVGIRAEDMEKLFKPFSQLDTGLPTLKDGTGLGLAISRHLVESMGGKITAASEWGKGSRFTFTLPAGE
jgi:PAS domain S-box-containing protein